MIEHRVLSTIIGDNVSLLKGLSDLDEQCFINAGCRDLFKLIKHFSGSGKGIDFDLLYEYANSNGFQNITAALIETKTYPTGSYRLDSDIRYLREERRKRDARKLAEKFWKALRAPSVDINESWESFSQEFSEIGLNDDGIHFSKEQGDLEFIGVGKRYPTGIEDVDEVIGGISSGYLVLVGGNTSAGKTALGLQMAQAQQCSVLVVLREMNFRQATIRQMTAATGIPYDKIELGILSDSDKDSIKKAAEELAEGPTVIYYDGSKCTAETICSLARRYRTTHNIEMVIVDYLQLVQSPRAKTREQEVAHISRSMKNLALELDIPIVALSQLNRAADVQEVPTLSNLRESGALEQDSDMVMLLYRDKKSIRSTDWIISIAKNRNGCLGDVRVTFDRVSMKFIERLDY